MPRHGPATLACRGCVHPRLRFAPQMHSSTPQELWPYFAPFVHPSQDDAKEARTTSELLEEAPVEELLEAKREAEAAEKLKAGLTRVARDPRDQD